MRKLSLNTIFASLYFLTLVVSVVFVIAWQQNMIKSINEVHQSEYKINLTNISRLLINNELEDIKTILRSNETYLKNKQYATINSKDIDFLFFIKDNILMDSFKYNLYFDEHELLKEIESIDSNKFISKISLNGKDTFILGAKQKVVDNITGRILGKIIGVKVLNDNITFANNLQQKLNILDLSLYHSEQTITSTILHSKKQEKNTKKLDTLLLEDINLYASFYIDNKNFNANLDNLFRNTIYLLLLYFLFGVAIFFLIKKTVVKKLIVLNNFIQEKIKNKHNLNYENCDILEIDQIANNFQSLYEKSLLSQNALKKEKNFIDTIIENTNTIIAVINSEGRMIKLNRYGQEFVGYSQEQISKEPFFWKRFLPFEVQSKVISIFDNAKTGHITNSTQNYWVSKSGEQKIFEWSNTVVKKDDGTMDYLVTIGIDVTKNKKLEEYLIEAKETAEKASKSKSDFLANMSHEIRTPLNAILGFVDILKDNVKDTQNKEYLNIINSSSHHLLGIINDILDFSKIESGKLEIEKVNFNTKDEFNSIINLFKIKTDEKHINFTANLSENIPPYLYSDILRVKQVIFNLISNAIKFTQNGKNITLDINYKDEQLYVAVSDEGIGIDKDKVSIIFDAFTQENSSTTREHGGTGLGLTIGYKLIEMLGGELKVSSVKNKGSKFYFTIPVKEIVKKDTNIENKNSENNEKFNAHILVVEDNKANQMFMKVLLKKLGVTFDIANDGLEAVEAFKINKYDMILMDENMPNLSGSEATKQIRKIEKENSLKHTFITALTANAVKGDRQRFINAGMDEYLTKPLDKKKLLDIMKEII